MSHRITQDRQKTKDIETTDYTDFFYFFIISVNQCNLWSVFIKPSLLCVSLCNFVAKN
jgi:hypothetical protein